MSQVRNSLKRSGPSATLTNICKCGIEIRLKKDVKVMDEPSFNVQHTMYMMLSQTQASMLKVLFGTQTKLFQKHS